MDDEVLAELRELRARVESLEVDNARLREAHAEAVAPDRADVPVDRRQLLKLAGKTAVVGTGLAAGAALLEAKPAAANHLPGFGHSNDQGAANTYLVGSNDSSALIVENNGVGNAIFGRSDDLNGVDGRSARFRGVQGTSDTGTGVYACQRAEQRPHGGDLRHERVQRRVCDVRERGQRGVRRGASGPGNAVLGINRGPGNCVFGFKPGGVTGDAVVGYSQTASSRGVLGLSTNGRGGAFSGKQAQVQLLASTATTHPSTGARGDLFVDNSGRLWFCKGSTTWRQLA